jgi:hypothetical protein
MNFTSQYKVDGISSEERMNNALTQNTFKIHDLTCEEIVLCSRQYGKNIRYVNFNNENDSTWGDVFSGDEITVLSDIKNFDMSTFVHSSISVLSGAIVTPQNYNKIFSALINIIRIIDHWYVQLKRIDNNVALLCVKTIENLIPVCFSNIYRDIAESVTDNVVSENNLILPKLSALWGSISECASIAPNGKKDKTAQCRKIIVTLHNLVAALKKSLDPFFIESLKRNDHSPETGLFLTFIELLGTVQKELNLMPGKYVQFYYRKVLQFQEKNIIPDKVHVTVVPNIRTTEVTLISKGSEFTAEEDSTVLTYTSDNDLSVQNCEVKSLFSLYFQEDQDIEPEKTLGYYSGIKINDFLDSDSGEPEKCFPIFGAAVNGKQVKHQGKCISAGLAIASKILFLSEGERIVRMQFCLNDELDVLWGDDFKKKIRTDTTISQDDTSGKIPDNGFIKILNSLFIIELTTPEGWYTVDNYHTTCSMTNNNFDKNSFSIEFVIPVNAAPIVSYNESIHGGRYSTVLPLCSITLNKNADVYPYSLLKGLTLNTIHIDVSVKGVSDLALFNQYGALDSFIPFMPFGPMPVKGDYLVIGYHEMANKNVDCADITIKWSNVPFQENGFKEYYTGYSYPFSNNSFEATITELYDGKWISGDESKNKIHLFDTEQNAYNKNENGIGRILPEKQIRQIPLESFREKSTLITKDAFSYTTKSKNGYLRLMLTNPMCGFGNSLYANDSASSMISQMYKRNKVTILSPPYVPVVSEIRLNYQSHTVIKFSHVYAPETDLKKIDSFYHIHPLGIHNLYPMDEIENITLIPELDKCGTRDKMKGNLFIGLKGNKPTGTLSLFFKMSEDTFTKEESKILWFYLRSNQWIEIEPRRLVSDSTYGLVTTGIVTMYLPDDFNIDQTIMPQGMYWLRASVENCPGKFGSVCSIKTNGVILTRNVKMSDTSMSKLSIAPGSIKELAVTSPGIDAVLQQQASFGGAIRESESEYVTRVSERLRHKNRVVTVYDYEHVITDKFPEVFKVKCFPNMSSNDTQYLHPGNVLIAVIAQLENRETTEFQFPKLNAVLLRKIETYVKKLSSACATIEVINPVYEEIQVRGSIVLKRDLSQVNAVYNVNKAISDFISPWSKNGNTTCFGWKIQLSELQQYIRALPQVEYITDFSVLHKTSNDSRTYNLHDSAEQAIGKRMWQSILPQVPWSICIPLRYHAIEVLDNIKNIRPDITGINKADVGNILIVKGKNGYGTAEQKNT